MTAVALIAKECAPGRAKTRLHPPLTLEQAAEVAAASLAATLDTVRALPADRRILFFDGDASTVDGRGFEVMEQPTGGLDERLAALFDAVDEPLLLVGMDTPQLEPRHVAAFFEAMADSAETPAVPTAASATPDTWFGPAADGGFWALGMRRPDGSLIRGVPMSEDDTGAHQLARLVEAGRTVAHLDELRDIDEFDDALAVADVMPGSAFAHLIGRLTRVAAAPDTSKEGATA